MSDDTPGAEPGALPQREGLAPRTERPATMRVTQLAGGQYVFATQQSQGVPALAQLSPGTLPNVQGGVTRIINISSARNQGSPVRPSLSNQSIVNVLTKCRSGVPNVKLQLYPNQDVAVPSTSNSGPTTPNTHSRSLKRSASSSPEKKDTFSAKLQRVMNHRIVRSKLVKEKYAEHLMELFYLESGGNILDLYQYAKRPKSQAYLAYMKEHAIDPKEFGDESPSVSIPHTTPSTPTATSASSLPGISVNNTNTSNSSGNSSQQLQVGTPIESQMKLGASNVNNQEQIVEKAKQEAYVVQRINDLQKEGIWSEKRLPKLQEMPRTKAHWDFLLEEMVWLAADFAQERKWKKAAAKKCSRMVQKYFQDKALAAQRAEKAHEQHLKRIAAFCAKEIKVFWSNVEKLVEYKQNTILEEKRKKALDQQLSFIVDQTEKYSQLLAEGMNKSSADVPSSNMSSRSTSRPQSDEEFDPEMQSDEDDEETIEQEEAALEDTVDQSAEVEALQRESQLELDDLLEDDLLRNYLLNRDNIKLSGSEESDDESEDGKSNKKSDNDKKLKERVVDSDDDNIESDDETLESESDPDERQNPQLEDNQNLKLLVDDMNKEGEISKTDEKDDLIKDAAAIAESIQPKGNTLSSTTVSTKVPFLLKLPLREYQHIGLDWLVTMYERKLNGILADEMGLGKTIQTIALLAHLACEKENWGPHLIVVPTSVMLNWEMECKKWCPAFKILTYYGSQKERKLKRTGWTKPNMFHICITSYKLVTQDHQSFRRKKWKYLILDEAQNIKNFKSQRWQLLLNFQTERRLLLTGTPLQNNLMELWSLMHFLMPNVFQSHREFKEWFSNPVTGMIEGNSEYNDSIIKRLHKVLRPFLLRRLKSEVEKQMPKKYEHVVMCRLSKRQRFLYDDYMSRAKTKETLASGNLLSVINVLMQLRKVCNHPNLFEVRPTISPFQCDNIKLHVPSLVYSALQYDVFKQINLYAMNLQIIMLEMHLGAYQCFRMRHSAKKTIGIESDLGDELPPCPPCKLSVKVKIRDKKEMPTRNINVNQSNTKVKVAGLQLVSQGVVKTVPFINISQAGGLGTPINVSSVLKPSDKVPTSFAQLVQTPTGKHLLLTSNPNMPVQQTTAGGQKLTFVSAKHPLATTNSSQSFTKAFVKFQLTSVTTGTTTTTSNSIATSKPEDSIKPVNSNFLGQLYSKQNSLDVRWKKDDYNRRNSNQAQDEPRIEIKKRFHLMSRINERRCSALPLYGRDFQDVVKIFKPNTVNTWNGGHIHCLNALFNKNLDDATEFLRQALYNPERRIEELKDVCDRFIFYVPAVKTDQPEIRVWHPPPSEYWARKEEQQVIQQLFSKPATPLHHIASAMVTQFPDPRLIQYDCGKLQTLDKLLRQLKTEGHRVLIFTQMTKMLDVLEAFLNFHGHIYLRLDGTTKVDQRQVLMERFNGDKRIFAFILSTRSGGVGVNLTGADTVIFYDSDWNPTMDAQAQDRCHRIGQTRDVHIYRLVSERTIEENILKKANQKRLLGDLAIEGGNFTTAYFKSTTIQDLFNIDQTLETAAQRMSEIVENRPSNNDVPEDKTAAGALESALAACEDDQDVQAAKIAKAEAVADLAEFDENIPLDQEIEKEPEISKAEQEINHIIEKLSPIEKYAMKFIEQTESAWSAEQLAAAERQIEEQKREWELNQMAAMREEEERRQRELEEENEMITYPREDAINQVSLKRKKHKFRAVHNKQKGIVRSGTVRVLKKKSSLQTKVPRSKRLKRLTVKKDDGEIGANVSIKEKEDTEVVAVENTTDKTIPVELDESSSESVQSESDLTLSELKKSPLFNHVDHNSPRTRSRGTVPINLWTLDVSPILPQIKRTRHKANHSVNDKKINISKKPSGVKRKESSDEEDDEEDEDISDYESDQKRFKDSCDLVEENSLPQCSIVLNDIIADGQYKIENSENSDLSEDSHSSTLYGNESKIEKDESTFRSNSATESSNDKTDESKPKINNCLLTNSHTDDQKNVGMENDVDSFISEYEEQLNDSTASDDVFMSEYEKELYETKTEEYKVEEEKASKETPAPHEVTPSEIATPATKTEIYVATYVNNTNGLEMSGKNSRSKTNFTFKSPEPRKTYRRYNRLSNNQTLDGWLNMTPPSPQQHNSES
ncbi:hypothetical protein ABEB36_012391 [Hypothenemus hampei]|uniref:Helicase domino n=1 Tax=Hypothenemus hampei TaxID=57062 RepID=A0ABD1EB48_HYPHA